MECWRNNMSYTSGNSWVDRNVHHFTDFMGIFRGVTGSNTQMNSTLLKNPNCTRTKFSAEPQIQQHSQIFFSYTSAWVIVVPVRKSWVCPQRMIYKSWMIKRFKRMWHNTEDHGEWVSKKDWLTLRGLGSIVCPRCYTLRWWHRAFCHQGSAEASERLPPLAFR